MTQLALSLAVLLLAAVFFAVIPGSGAFLVRARWRAFRARLTEASLLDAVEYRHLQQKGSHPSLRFLGRLEALQGDDMVWVTDGHFSVAADLADVPVYLLPSSQDPGGDGDVGEETPRSVRWKRIHSLPQGTQILLAGPFLSERGRGIFRSRDREKLLAVIYDGDPATLLARAIVGGRQRNEYWNQYTAVSLVLGSFALLLAAFLLLRDPYNKIPALLAVTASLFPVSALLPPGVLLYLPYRQLWRRARRLRAERDLLRLPLRHFRVAGDTETLLPDGERYAMRLGSEIRCREPPVLRSPLHLRSAAAPRTFGAVEQDELGEILARPTDPLAELVRVPGDPALLARECAQRARVLELVSGLLILGDVGANLFLALVAFARVLP